VSECQKLKMQVRPGWHWRLSNVLSDTTVRVKLLPVARLQTISQWCPHIPLPLYSTTVMTPNNQLLDT